MDLNFKIIKNRHGRYEDSSRLERNLRGCHVLSLEHKRATEEEARREEEHFRELYDLDKPSRRATLAEERRSTRDYLTNLYKYIIRNKVPVVLLERHSPAEAQRLEKDFENISGEEVSLVIDTLYGGDPIKALELEYARLKKLAANADQRDRSVGRSSKKILDRILELYPHLKTRQSLTYGVIIGALHFPEKYIFGTGTVSVVDAQIPGVFKTSGEITAEKVVHGASLEEAREEIAQFLLLLCLIKAIPKHDLTLEVATLLVRELGSQELGELTSRFASPEEVGEKTAAFFEERRIQLPQRHKDFVGLSRQLSQT